MKPVSHIKARHATAPSAETGAHGQAAEVAEPTMMPMRAVPIPLVSRIRCPRRPCRAIMPCRWHGFTPRRVRDPAASRNSGRRHKLQRTLAADRRHAAPRPRARCARERAEQPARGLHSACESKLAYSPAATPQDFRPLPPGSPAASHIDTFRHKLLSR